MGTIRPLNAHDSVFRAAVGWCHGGHFAKATELIESLNHDFLVPTDPCDVTSSDIDELRGLLQAKGVPAWRSDDARAQFEELSEAIDRLAALVARGSQ